MLSVLNDFLLECTGELVCVNLEFIVNILVLVSTNSRLISFDFEKEERGCSVLSVA